MVTGDAAITKNHKRMVTTMLNTKFTEQQASVQNGNVMGWEMITNGTIQHN